MRTTISVLSFVLILATSAAAVTAETLEVLNPWGPRLTTVTVKGSNPSATTLENACPASVGPRQIISVSLGILTTGCQPGVFTQGPHTWEHAATLANDGGTVSGNCVFDNSGFPLGDASCTMSAAGPITSLLGSTSVGVVKPTEWVSLIDTVTLVTASATSASNKATSSEETNTVTATATNLIPSHYGAPMTARTASRGTGNMIASLSSVSITAGAILVAALLL